MSIGKRVMESLDKLALNDADGALLPGSAAIAGTATKFYGDSTRSNYKKFIVDNMKLITRIAFNGPTVENLRFGVPQRVLDKTPDMKPRPDGSYGVEDILYHVVRCGLDHEATWPNGFQFQFDHRGGISNQNDTLEIPGSLILGLMVAVVCCPANAAGETIESRFCMTFNSFRPDHGQEIVSTASGYTVPLNRLWGKKEQLWNLYEAMDAIWKNPFFVPAVAKRFKI